MVHLFQVFSLIKNRDNTHAKKGNYRIISPTNKDVNLLNKIRINWIQSSLNRMLHRQERFIPGMQIWLNIRKSIPRTQ